MATRPKHPKLAVMFAGLTILAELGRVFLGGPLRTIDWIVAATVLICMPISIWLQLKR